MGGFRFLVLPPRWLREHQLLLLSVMVQSAVLSHHRHCCNPLCRNCLFPSPQRLSDLPDVSQPGSGGAGPPAIHSLWRLGDLGPLVLAWETISGRRADVSHGTSQCGVSVRETGRATVPTSPRCLVWVPETSPLEHLSSVWSYRVSVLGEATHSTTSTGTDKTWRRCPGWSWVGTASLVRDLSESSSLL